MREDSLADDESRDDVDADLDALDLLFFLRKGKFFMVALWRTVKQNLSCNLDPDLGLFATAQVP